MNGGIGHAPDPTLQAVTYRAPGDLSPWVNLALLLFTIVSTHIAGIALTLEDFDLSTLAGLLGRPSAWLMGAPYAIPVLFILGVHEMGHYVACRFYGVRSSLPFFIPGPPLFGTFGAVIRIRAPIPNRRALFDIGVAGPIAGFVAAIPVLIYGLAHSTVVNDLPTAGTVILPSCLLLDYLQPLFFPGAEVAIQVHPAYVAAWVGMLATGLNLLPVGQLDGGHMLYSLSRPAHRLVSRLGVVALVITGVIFGGWHLVIFGLVFGILGPGHPPTLDDGIRPGSGRTIVAVIGLLILVLTLIVRGPSVL